jgi:hypothetical protein
MSADDAAARPDCESTSKNATTARPMAEKARITTPDSRVV